mmetsp:Transcript_2684/g.5926  ORF Transcript_2684/g.5926 Transcript_2684/m.5926 type:complete len:215 (+) Transcript_2684:2398-3042(+)
MLVRRIGGNKASRSEDTVSADTVMTLSLRFTASSVAASNCKPDRILCRRAFALDSVLARLGDDSSLAPGCAEASRGGGGAARAASSVASLAYSCFSLLFRSSSIRWHSGLVAPVAASRALRAATICPLSSSTSTFRRSSCRMMAANLMSWEPIIATLWTVVTDTQYQWLRSTARKKSLRLRDSVTLRDKLVVRILDKAQGRGQGANKTPARFQS